MNRYSFEALDAGGRTVRGRRLGASLLELRSELERERLTPISIRVSRLPVLAARTALTEAEAGRLARDLARYLRSGLSAVQALALLEDAGTPRVRRFAGRARERIMSGALLSQAFEEVGGQSGRLLRALASGGEGSGRQADVLDLGGQTLLASAALKNRLLTLSLYPLFVLAIALAAVALYAFGVLPALEPAFGDLTGELAASTKLVLEGGRIMRVLLPAAGLAALALAVVLLISARARLEARELGGRLLSMRWAGGLLTDLVFAGFSARMAISMKAGVPLPAAYHAAIDAVGFRRPRDLLTMQADRLRDGAPLSSALMESRLAPLDLIRLVQVGERADDLATLLDEAGRMLSTRAQEKAERLLAAVTPLVVVVIGAIVGGVTLMVFQGLLAVTNAVDL